MSSLTREGLPERLLAWFAAHARDLPWRQTRDPYAILVAEIMLQQTQVERVVPKYLAFLAAFPSLEALAAAPTGMVIRLWAGLGYNRRAVNLQRAAAMIGEQYGGVFPREVAELRRLPGVGPYTAGAVACFAFEQDVAFMDTNIRRVLRRALVGSDGVEPAPSDRQLLDLGAALLPAGRGWAWNQALIELGALVCRASAPACWHCPLRSDCQAYAASVAADQAMLQAMSEGAPRVMRRAAEGRVAYRPEQPFIGSQRWYRGRLIDVLRTLPPTEALPLAELGPRVREGFAVADMPWLRDLAAGLARDGLLVIEDETVRLP